MCIRIISSSSSVGHAHPPHRVSTHTHKTSARTLLGRARTYVYGVRARVFIPTVFRPPARRRRRFRSFRFRSAVAVPQRTARGLYARTACRVCNRYRRTRARILTHTYTAGLVCVRVRRLRSRYTSDFPSARDRHRRRRRRS